MPEYRFTVPFIAGKQRPRFAKGHAYKTGTEVLHEEAIALAFDEAGGTAAPADTPVHVTIHGLKKRAKFAGKPFTGKPDTDNIAKLVLDALNGRAWHDDSQIVDLHVSKGAYSENVDRISVIIDWREE